MRVSNSAADRAGEVFRVATRDRRAAFTEGERQRILEALILISEYRRMHGTPMASVTMGIRSMVKTVRGNDEIRPGQRFKRLDRILGKLLRYPRMRIPDPVAEAAFATLRERVRPYFQRPS